MQINTTIKLLSAVLISSVLTACGGAGSSSVAGAGGGGGGVRIGIGSGASFVPTKMQIATSSALFEGQTTTITVNLVDNQGAAIDTPINVTFSSNCIKNGTSSITGGNVIKSVNGTAIAEYKAGTCLGDDTVYATINSSSVNTATGVISGINQKSIGTGTGTSFVAGQLAVSTGTTVLYAGDVTSISANVVDTKGNLVTQGVTVHFGSSCLTDGSSTVTGGSQDVVTVNGTAKIDYKVGTCFIDDVVTAHVTNGVDTVNASTTLSIDSRHIGSGTGANLKEGNIDIGIGDSTLSPGGSTTLTAYVVNSQGETVNDTMSLTFSSPCISSGNATITGGTGNVITSNNGKFVATYTSTGCAGINGEDAIKATAPFRTTTLTATGAIKVKTDAAQTISFVDAKPGLINIKGTGGTETSIVRFQVTGQAGSPVKGVCVTFAVNTSSDLGAGALTLVPSKCNPAGPETYGSTSDANGYVSTVVQAGSVPTPVSVTATTSNGISTQSNNLSVTTGIPDQNSMSLSVSDKTPNSWTHDGTSINVTIRLADAFNNPVPDGTSVSFTTSGGSIQSSCPTLSGVCSVNWTSQEPRPMLLGLNTYYFYRDPTTNTVKLHCSNNASECRNGRVMILATAIGNESFIDGNGNGLYDNIDKDIFVNSNGIMNTANKGLGINNTPACSPNAPLPYAKLLGNVAGSCDDLREAYLDKNFSSDRDPNEEFIDFDLNGEFTTVANGKYNGVLCAGTAKANGDCTTDKVTIRQDYPITMSDDHAIILFYNSGINQYINFSNITSVFHNSSYNISLLLTDTNGNAMPVGTSISIDTSNLGFATATISPNTVTGDTEPAPLTLSIKTDINNDPTGSIVINVTSGKITTSKTIRIN